MVTTVQKMGETTLLCIQQFQKCWILVHSYMYAYQQDCNVLVGAAKFHVAVLQNNNNCTRIILNLHETS